MRESLDAMTVAAVFGAFWALVLGALVALRLCSERGRSRGPLVPRIDVSEEVR